MAQSSLSAKTLGYCVVSLELDGKTYSNLRLSVLSCLCADLILGLDFQEQHESISFHHGGPKPPLVVCGLTTLKVESPDLFANLSSDVRPIATKSRRYSHEDRKFIDSEVQRLLAEGITYNHDKSIFSTRRLPILGYIIENGQIRPDPDCLRPLLELQAPNDMKSLCRILGFFSHYSQWIQGYSEKICPLTTTSTFPMSQDAQTVFESLKTDIANSVVSAINEDIPFEVETDASDYAIAATLNQNGRPVAFFSRMLHGPEISHASVEKEAKAIIEAVRHWRHYLTGRHFTITTDQLLICLTTNRGEKLKMIRL